MKLPKPSRPVLIHVPVDLDRDVGLGDAVKRVTTGLGFRPCAACRQRAEAMNRFVTFRSSSRH